MKRSLFATLAALMFYNAHASVITGSNLEQFADSGKGEWSMLGKATKTAQPQTFNELFKFDFEGKNYGTWSVTNTSDTDITLDLAMTLHAGSQNTSYLVDDLTLLAGTTYYSPWSILPGKNGKFPDLNQLVVYERDIVVSQVPEPTTLSMLALGLGLIGLRRREQ